MDEYTAWVCSYYYLHEQLLLQVPFMFPWALLFFPLLFLVPSTSSCYLTISFCKCNNKAGQVNNIHYFVKMVLSKGCVIKHEAGSKQSDVEVEVDTVHVVQAGQLGQSISEMAGLVECFLYTVVSTYKTLEKGGELNGQRLICAV